VHFCDLPAVLAGLYIVEGGLRGTLAGAGVKSWGDDQAPNEKENDSNNEEEGVEGPVGTSLIEELGVSHGCVLPLLG